MKLGDLEFLVLNDGTLRLDGGAMFGVIPKPMWEKKSPADDRNRIVLAMNCLLIRAAGKTILVETGAGDKWDAKRRDIYAFEGSPRLPDQLAAHGVKPENVDFVINTHLHFDHCGWNTRIVNGKARPTFANARYVVQKKDFDHAKNPTERDRASFISENYLPVEEAGQWWLLEGETEIVPGVTVFPVPGHTHAMQCVKLTGAGKTAIFLADLVPTTAHLPLAWIMGFDLFPLTTLENRKKWLPQIATNGWLALFAHDRAIRAAYLRERNGNYEAEPAQID
ncbi:MAG TPA: MBL fold metallo-hydrolase [Candidatus Acidoferrales bacterium]|nr:MBL fold metallo-hydrolase [Candidatus Acidoferrales bacterium]